METAHRVDLRQYFCYRVLKNSRNDFLLRYIDDAVCIQSEFWNDRKADEGEGHKDADIFRYTMCLEGIVSSPPEDALRLNKILSPMLTTRI